MKLQSAYAFLKGILKDFIFIKKKKRFIYEGKILLNKNSEVRLIDGAQKNNIHFKNNVMFYGRIIVSGNGKVHIGENTSIRSFCIFYCAKSIKIGSDVILADHVIISDTNHHPIHPVDRQKMVRGGWGNYMWSWEHSVCEDVIIEDNVWIGQYARILKGVRIGRNSIVASNSVVTKDVPENCIVAGNPARIVKENIEKENQVFLKNHCIQY